MDTKTIYSRQLNKLNQGIKRDINDGRLFLYDIIPDGTVSQAYSYALYIGDDVYLLNKRGKILSKRTGENQIHYTIGSLVYFKDFPRPESLANYSLQ